MRTKFLPIIIASAALWSCTKASPFILKDREMTAKLKTKSESESTTRVSSSQEKDNESEIPFPNSAPTQILQETPNAKAKLGS